MRDRAKQPNLAGLWLARPVLASLFTRTLGRKAALCACHREITAETDSMAERAGFKPSVPGESGFDFAVRFVAFEPLAPPREGTGYSRRRSRSSLGPARATAKTTVGLLVRIRLESISPLTDRAGRATFLASRHSHSQPCGRRAAACRDNRTRDINLQTIICATRDRKNGPSGDGMHLRLLPNFIKATAQ
jgi:hypothetical protein